MDAIASAENISKQKTTALEVITHHETLIFNSLSFFSHLTLKVVQIGVELHEL